MPININIKESLASRLLLYCVIVGMLSHILFHQLCKNSPCYVLYACWMNIQVGKI